MRKQQQHLNMYQKQNLSKSIFTDPPKWLLWLLKSDNFDFNVCSLMHDSTDHFHFHTEGSQSVYKQPCQIILAQTLFVKKLHYFDWGGGRLFADETICFLNGGTESFVNLFEILHFFCKWRTSHLCNHAKNVYYTRRPTCTCNFYIYIGE